jgi:hypothetical protein
MSQYQQVGYQQPMNPMMVQPQQQYQVIDPLASGGISFFFPLLQLRSGVYS